MEELLGYRRENGRVGVRNHVVILPVDDISNAACEAVASHIEGTLALPHSYGRLQYGEDLELHFRTMIGTGSNPNVAAAVVIGIEENWTKRVADGIAKTGKPVASFSIEGSGDLETVRRASWKAKEFVQWASELRREAVELKDLTVSIKCGESDTTTGLGSCPTVGTAVEVLVDAGASVFFGETSELTGGEHLIAERMATPELREKFEETYDAYVSGIESRGVDLLGSQPTQGNIAGGLSTIEEKALGNIEKTGTQGGHRRAGARRSPSGRARALLYGQLLGRGRARHADGRRRGGCAHVSHGARQRRRQPHRPCYQGHGQPEDGFLHGGAHRRGRQRASVSGDHLAGGRGAIDGQPQEDGRTAEMTSAETLGHREFSMTKLYPSA